MKCCANLCLNSTMEKPQVPGPKSVKSSTNNIGTYRLIQYQNQAHNLSNTKALNSKNGVASKRPNRTSCPNRDGAQKKGLIKVSRREGSENNSHPKLKINLSNLGAKTFRESVGAKEGVAARMPASHPFQAIQMNSQNLGTKNPTKTPYITSEEYIKCPQKYIKVLQNNTSRKSIPSYDKENENRRHSFKPENLSKRGDNSLEKAKTTILLLQSILKSQNTPKPVRTQKTSVVFDPSRKMSLGNSVDKHRNCKKIQSSSHPTIKLSNNNCKEKPTFPMTPKQALQSYGTQLTHHEKGEIIGYKEIFFIGNSEIRNKSTTKFDSESGDYLAYVGDHIAFRYEIVDLLGKGSFGQTLKCIDHKERGVVALKIIKSKKRFYKQASLEVKLLRYIKEHDTNNTANVIKMFDSFVFRNHICITFEILGQNLYECVRDTEFKGLPLELIKKYAIQLLHSLKFLREHSIVHCDLKPENVLISISDKSMIQLIDFGSGCFQEEQIYYQMVKGFYRAPEIMLAIPYTTAIDMWSLGCILAELYTGFPIFPGENEPEQMGLIMEVIGMPPKELLSQATRKEVFFDKENRALSSTKLLVAGGKSLQKALKCDDEGFLDFLARCFTWFPEKRITPEEALKHSWIFQPSEVQNQTHLNSNPSHNLKTALQIFTQLAEKKIINKAQLQICTESQEHHPKYLIPKTTKHVPSYLQENAKGKLKLMSTKQLKLNQSSQNSSDFLLHQNRRQQQQMC